MNNEQRATLAENVMTLVHSRCGDDAVALEVLFNCFCNFAVSCGITEEAAVALVQNFFKQAADAG